MSKNVKKKRIYICIHIYVYVCIQASQKNYPAFSHLCSFALQKFDLNDNQRLLRKTQRSGTEWSRGNGSSITDEGKERYAEGVRDMYRNVCLRTTSECWGAFILCLCVFI